MAGRHSRRRRKNWKMIRMSLAVCAVALVMGLGISAAQFLEAKMHAPVDNAGRQMTAHTKEEGTSQVFMNDQWYRKKKVETLLVIGIDDFGTVAGSDSYNNTNQADFLMLLVSDEETREKSAIHLDRDTMTEITVLGVTGRTAGVQRAQLALAYNYGNGQGESSRNTVEAVSRLLYGTAIDHYITVTMDAVPILNDWVGGVQLKIRDDMTGADSALVSGEEIRLTGEQALAYVRTRKGLDDSTNINRMARQRQYASAWVDAAQEQLSDENSVAELIVRLNDYHYSDCPAEKLAELAAGLGGGEPVVICELPGEAVKGAQYMEFHADDEGIVQMVLDIFYTPAESAE